MAAPILVFGHKNPDNDAISAAVGYAYLKNELAKRAGSDAVYEACRLGGLPPETEWILGENGIEAPRLIESLSEGQQVILVDHNEALQSADGLDAAEIVEIVDHHRLGGLVTAQPLRFNAKPVGSTAAIVAREFEIEGVELPRGIAALLLGAKDAFACDIDDKCVGVAYENAALNGVGKEHYTVRAGDVLSDKRLQKEFGGDYDVIVANIVADVIIALAPQVGKLLKKGGIFLCSGIIDDRADEVREKLVEAGWTIEETRSSEGWFSYLCR